MNMIFKGIVTIIALIIVLYFGFWLSKNGKPYNDIFFTIHKVVALLMIIYSFFYIKQHFAIVKGNSLLIIILILIGLCILILFLTGALLSIGKVDYLLLIRIHLPVAILITVMILSFLALLLKDLS